MNYRISIFALLLFFLCAPAFAANTTYIYDDLNRLTAAYYDDGIYIIYTYDEIGNRTRKISFGYYSITVSADTNGTISPGSASVLYGGSQAFTIKPNTGYYVTWVSGTCGGSYTGDPSDPANGITYTTNAVTANCTVLPNFSLNTHTVTPSAGTNGSISPNTPQIVNHNAATSFTITPATGYGIASVIGCGGTFSGITYTTAPITQNCIVTAAFINSLTVTPSAGANGSISPNTPQSVNHDAAASFTITPDAGYHIADVLVDGISQGAVTNYTFANITANHSITATFAINTYTITAIPGSGIVSPTSATVNHGSSQTFTITPLTGFHIADVLVDGISQGAVTNYTFANISTNHSITATFAINTYAITAIPGLGIVSPTIATVNHGSNQTFTITTGSRYAILDVKVDGISQGAISSYTFSNVTAPHTIEASYYLKFCPNPPSRILGATPVYFKTLQEAYNTAANGATIQTQGQVFPEAFSANLDKTVIIDGGYTCDYSVNPDKTMLQGAPHISSGVVNWKNSRIGMNFGAHAYEITTGALVSGSISPGSIRVNTGGSQTFTITPLAGFHVADVMVDGVSQGAVSSYTFTNVTTSHSISARFAKNTYLSLLQNV